MKTVTVTCDSCGRDITSTTNCVDFGIVLANERMKPASHVVTAMNVDPPLHTGTSHFCGVGCLKHFIAKHYP